MFTRADKVLIVALILISSASYPAIKYLTPRGSFLEIEVEGEKTMVVSMDRYRDIEVEGRLGACTIRIDASGARFIGSACADKRCIESDPIKDAGEIAACVPNRVMLRVLGDNRESVDVISR